jgi:hypothetical protein
MVSKVAPPARIARNPGGMRAHERRMDVIARGAGDDGGIGMRQAGADWYGD